MAVYEDYLVHHGVKGQKWGIRKEEYRIGINRRIRKNKDPRQTLRGEYKDIKRDYNIFAAKRFGIGAGAGLALGTGAALVSNLVGGPIGQMALPVAMGLAVTGDLISLGMGISKIVDYSTKLTTLYEIGEQHGLTRRDITRRRD